MAYKFTENFVDFPKTENSVNDIVLILDMLRFKATIKKSATDIENISDKNLNKNVFRVTCRRHVP